MEKVIDNLSLKDLSIDEIEISPEIQDKDVNTDFSIADLSDAFASIPERMGFKIGEAADIVGVKQYVLRYWETEFDQLKPQKSANNQRMYTRKDVETALMIKKLLYKERFSIEGARKAIRKLKSQVKEDKAWDTMDRNYERAIYEIGLVKQGITRLRDLFS
jgi:DNA-binding transcriptional MerR regulator